MTTRIAILAAACAAPALFLAACGQAEDPTSNAIVNVGNETTTNTTTATANVTLPPAIKSTVTYRCTGDNSVIQVNFLADDVTANVRPADQDTATPTVLTAGAPGEAFEAEGYSLSGSGETVTYTSPGGGTQTCRSGPAS